MGLIEARIDTYAGIVFATWAADAPGLEAYLGDARWYLDTVFNRRDCGMQALGPMKWLEPVNWKTLVDAPEAIKHITRTGSQANNGAAGLFEQDDIDNWRQVTTASRSRIARQYPQELSMGIGHAGAHPDYPGLVSELYISENNQRHFYLRWQEFMNAENWVDIPLDPITARFEGTATMQG